MRPAKARVQIKFTYPRSGYAIDIGPGLLASAGTWAATCLNGKRVKLAVISNAKVFGLYGETVKQALEASGFQVVICLIGDGERFKSFATLQKVLDSFGANRMSRSDAVIALGGGVVGDLAGFAASIYLRGVSFLQIPTTLLSMIDSSVGGKTGVNSKFGKNLIGAFYQPKGVLVDINTLSTLPKRELTAGFCEAIKQGAIANRKLFDQTAGFLEKYQLDDLVEPCYADGLASSLTSLLRAQIAFKAKIVSGDERESPGKTDAASRKVLNFGHTFAHALEKVTNYKYLRHGEAVGYGIRFAAELSKKLGLLAADDVDLLNDVVHRAGALPPIDNIEPQKVFETFSYDKKLIDNSLQWILLEGIGRPVIFPNSKIPHAALTSAFKSIIRS